MNRTLLGLMVAIIVLLGHFVVTLLLTNAWEDRVESAIRQGRAAAAEAGEDDIMAIVEAASDAANEPNPLLELFWAPITSIAIAQSGGAISKWAMFANALLWGGVAFLAVFGMAPLESTTRLVRWHLGLIALAALGVGLGSVVVFGPLPALLMGFAAYEALTGAVRLALGSRPKAQPQGFEVVR